MSSELPDTLVPSNETRYSARVRIRLHINGQTYSVAQIGGGRLIFDAPVTFEESTGVIVMTVDDNVERWHVAIPHQPTPSRTIAARLMRA